ncbi:MAG: cytochrome c [Anaerolineales bacterium]|nr:cytochrome c [Anaerolineales bacterium]
MKKSFLYVAVLIFILLAACGAPASTNTGGGAAAVPAEYAGQTNPLGAEAAAEGAKVFRVNCVACHGEQGHGDGPAGAALSPAPKNLAELQTTVADDYLYWRIRTGSPGTAMAPWQGILTDEQIWQVVAFIRTLK